MHEPERRLAGIVAADVVGYSRLLGQDEAATLARVRALRSEIIEPQAAAHAGRLFKTTGDGFLLAFPSAVQALRCALAIQAAQRAEGALQLRIGVHQGEVIPDGDDLHGDGVVIAARLEPLAEPGGIALSARVREDAMGKVAIETEDLGTPALKNIAQPIQVFRIRPAAPERQALALPDKPSLVVLPFQNMSGDPEQEYFADGMVEDITTALSRIGGLFVIARNSAFTYKGKPVDVKAVGRELGVRYVVEGSVRKAGGRVRITAQLIEAATATHLWADRFDGPLDDIFDLQDRVTDAIAGAIEPTLLTAEISRALNKPTDRLDAYDLLLRARALMTRYRRVDGEHAVQLARQAAALDPRFAQAKSLAAYCISLGISAGWWRRTDPIATEGLGFARAALADAGNDPTVLGKAGLALSYLAHENIAARAAVDRALALNPHSSLALLTSAWVHLYEGIWLPACEEFTRALRLSPRDPQLRFLLVGLGLAKIELGDAETALDILRKGVAVGQGDAFGRNATIHCLIALGRVDEAKALVRSLLADNPSSTIASARQDFAMYPVDYCERRLSSLRLAGLPE